VYAAFDYLSDAAHASKLVVEIGSLDGREPNAWSIRVIPSTLDTKVRVNLRMHIRAYKWRIGQTKVKIAFDMKAYVVGKSQSVARL